jgi:3-hydroxy-9,10-secoandrosta-1,3,5(10)-triene-9,17-dione monooxygenase
VTAVVGAHHWLIGLFPEAAQDDVFAEDPDAMISAVISSRGKARRTHGGYVLSGFWPFCSGSPSADWVMLGGLVQDESGRTIDEGEFLVPVADIEVKDDWNVASLKATGSNSVVAREIFVPDHRFLSMGPALKGISPGRDLHEGTLYHSGTMPVLAIVLGPPAVGMAQGALADFQARLPGREVIYTYHEKQLEMPVTHVTVADAATRIHAARSILHNSATEIASFADRRESMPMDQRAQVRMDTAYASRLCLEAVNMLYLASGGGAVALGNNVQRAWLDLHAINLHGLNCLDTAREMYGRVVLGLPQNTDLI